MALWRKSFSPLASACARKVRTVTPQTTPMGRRNAPPAAAAPAANPRTAGRRQTGTFGAERGTHELLAAAEPLLPVSSQVAKEAQRWPPPPWPPSPSWCRWRPRWCSSPSTLGPLHVGSSMSSPVMHGRLLRGHNASKMPFKRPSRSSAGGSLERAEMHFT